MALCALAMLAASGTMAPTAAAQPTEAPVPRYEGYQIPDASVPDRSAHLRSDLVPNTPRLPPDDWIARDKALHVGASFLLTLSGQYVLVDKAELSNGDAVPVSAGTALALGLLKEVSDSRRQQHPLFSWRDLAANAAGVALAVAVVAW